MKRRSNIFDISPADRDVPRRRRLFANCGSGGVSYARSDQGGAAIDRGLPRACRGTQGYARKRSIAVSPLAELPHKTRCHELAHVVFGHTVEAEAGLSDSDLTPRSLREVEAEAVALVCLEALGLPGAEHCRGYIQHWNEHRGAEPIPERSAQRIFKAADQILKAGTAEVSRPAVGQ
jgi:hypothetical protein